jgi:hypothetical protein
MKTIFILEKCYNAFVTRFLVYVCVAQCLWIRFFSLREENIIYASCYVRHDTFRNSQLQKFYLPLQRNALNFNLRLVVN